jgi:hypothetical protein
MAIKIYAGDTELSAVYAGTTPLCAPPANVYAGDIPLCATPLGGGTIVQNYIAATGQTGIHNTQSIGSCADGSYYILCTTKNDNVIDITKLTATNAFVEQYSVTLAGIPVINVAPKMVIDPSDDSIYLLISVSNSGVPAVLSAYIVKFSANFATLLWAKETDSNLTPTTIILSNSGSLELATSLPPSGFMTGVVTINPATGAVVRTRSMLGSLAPHSALHPTRVFTLTWDATNQNRIYGLEANTASTAVLTCRLSSTGTARCSLPLPSGGNTVLVGHVEDTVQNKIALYSVDLGSKTATFLREYVLSKNFNTSQINGFTIIPKSSGGYAIGFNGANPSGTSNTLDELVVIEIDAAYAVKYAWSCVNTTRRNSPGINWVLAYNFLWERNGLTHASVKALEGDAPYWIAGPSKAITATLTATCGGFTYNMNPITATAGTRTLPVLTGSDFAFTANPTTDITLSDTTNVSAAVAAVNPNITYDTFV